MTESGSIVLHSSCCGAQRSTAEQSEILLHSKALRVASLPEALCDTCYDFCPLILTSALPTSHATTKILKTPLVIVSGLRSAADREYS